MASHIDRLQAADDLRQLQVANVAQCGDVKAIEQFSQKLIEATGMPIHVSKPLSSKEEILAIMQG